MRFPPLAAAFLAALLCLGLASAEEDDLIAKVCKAHGELDTLGSAKTFEYWGVYKGLGGVMAKFDYTATVRLPSDLRLQFEGIEGTFRKFGRHLLGDRGWSSQMGATRPMAPDEVRAAQRIVRDFLWLGRLKEGHQKYERLPDREFDGVQCASIRLLGEERRLVELHFDKETWLLHRRDETLTARAGGESSEYTLFEDYEEIEGIQVARIQKIYVNQLMADKEKEKFRLVEKLEIDEFTLSPEIEEGYFDAPEDLFDVSGLNPDSAKARAEKLLTFFKGRRNPNKAGWACSALARLQAREAIGSLVESRNKEISHYGHLALIRSGSASELPDDYQASTYKRKVDVALGYTKGTGQLSVRYVGCAGVRLDALDTTVFVDAIYQRGLFHTAYPALDCKTIVKADALLFTHAHRDHFDPWEAADVMKRTGAVAVGPPTVIALLKKEGVAEDRLIPLQPGKDKPVKAKAGKVEIEAHAVGHAGKFTKKGKPEHLAFVLRFGAIKVVHFGAAGETKGMDEEAAKGAELFFLPNGMLVEKNREFFKTTGVRYFVPTRYLDTQGFFGSLIGLRDRFKKVVPMLPGQELTFH